MKTAIKRVLPFLLSFLFLCVFAVQCFRAPSVGASDVFSVSPYVFGDYNKADYEITLDDITAPGIVFCMAEYAYGTPPESVNVSFSGVDTINIISNDYKGSSNVESADCTAYVFWAYVTDIESITITVYNSLSRDNTFFGFIPNCDTIDYLSLDEVSAGGNYEMELAEGNNYLISYIGLNNGSYLSPLVQCNAVLVGAKPRRVVYMYDGTTPSTVTYAPRSMPGAMAVYRVYDSSAVGGGTGTDTGQQQLEVSNNILTNLKNILQYIANLPSNIFNAFSERITAIINAIQTLPQLIADNIESILTRLFIPADGFIQHCIDSIMDAIYERFPFIDTLFTLWKNVNTRLSSADSSAPVFSITYDGTEIVFMDFSIFEPYIADVRAIILAIVWIVFSIHMIKKVPGIVQGSPDPAVIRTNLDKVEL